MRRRLTALAILITLGLVAIPFASVSGKTSASPSGQTSATGTVTTMLAPTLAITPTVVVPSGSITVVAENLPISSAGPTSADQYCAYLTSSAGVVTPLARIPTPTGGATDLDPSLTPSPAAATTGIGSFIVPGTLLPGAYTVQIASCALGAAPAVVMPVVASAAVQVGTVATSGLPTVTVPGVDFAHPLPVGTAFTAALSGITAAACAFVAPVDVWDSINWTAGVPIAANATTVSLTLPAGYPSGRYQIFITKVATGGACPATQVTGSNVVASTVITATAGKIASITPTSATGAPVAGGAVNIAITLPTGATAPDVCLAAWYAGTFTGLEVTDTAAAITASTALAFSIPATLSGTVTITATAGACPAAATATAGTATPAVAPTTFDAYTTFVVAAAPAVTTTATGTPATATTAPATATTAPATATTVPATGTTVPVTGTTVPVTAVATVPPTPVSGNVRFTCNSPGGPACPTATPTTVTPAVSSNIIWTCNAPGGPPCSTTATPGPTATTTAVTAGAEVARVRSGGVLRLRMRTAPRAHVTLRLRVLGHRARARHRTVILYQTIRHGSARPNGWYKGSLHVTYRTLKRARARLLVTVHARHGTFHRFVSVLILPRPHAKAHHK